MNRYNFSQDVIIQDKFPKCKICGGGFIRGHECPGPKIPSLKQAMLEDDGLTQTPFRQIWTNANEVMREVEDLNYDPSWDDPDD